jgi:hypothetical protein
MSYENPTRLRIGMHGDFGGTDFRLIGRVVIGVMIDGEAYYWNEFNLQAKDNTVATLVFEGTEDGGEWRLFTDFTPEFPMDAADAATKRVGDELNLNGTNVRVTLVQSSRVYRIEGEPPEGVKVGSLANYFNAEAGDLVQVVSWTGDEVEYYNGFTLSRDAVEKAFDLPPAPPAKIFSRLSDDNYSDSENYTSLSKFGLQIAALIVFLIIIFGSTFTSCSTTREASAVKKIFAAPLPLAIGVTGNWGGKKLNIIAHARVEIDEVGAIYERHEYILSDDDGNQSLLVCGEKPDAKDWIFFTPLAPLVPPTPAQAAAEKVGDLVNVDGVVATVDDLFQSTIESVDNVAITSWHGGDINFNYFASIGSDIVFARWNNTGIHFYRGETVSPKDFSAHFFK